MTINKQQEGQGGEQQASGKAAASSGSPGALPTISLPKGGGAIRGIGETFTTNPVTGTGSMSFPIFTSPGRSSFGPKLSLSYDSGSGNGPFGFGWSLSLPSITRKTSKGLPQYIDDDDVYILAGADDLVPVYRQDPDGSWVAAHPGFQRDADGFWVRDADGQLVIHEDELDGYRVRRYRPRIEGMFVRVERWTRLAAPADVHWRSISKDNILTVYGHDDGSDTLARIADPLDPSRIFSWLICESRDDKGNAVLYRYKAEDGTGVDLNHVHERNRGPRNDPGRTANRYLKRIYYGNRTPLLDNAGNRLRFLDQTQIDTQIANAGWMFEVVLDYGDHDVAIPKPGDDVALDGGGNLRFPWKLRPDPFSTYRSRFEVRTARVCQRALMFHHFPGEAGVERDCLVRSTDFNYSDEVDPTDVRNPVYTFLQAATQTGYQRNNGGYNSRSLPPVEFTYSEAIVQDTVEEVDPTSIENLPVGLDGSSYRWTDLHGEGIPGILTEQADSWIYKRNLSPIPRTLADGRKEVKAHFAPAEIVLLKPNQTFKDGEFMDLAGDGQPDMVVMAGPAPGLYEHDDEEGWQPFRPFTSPLNRNLRDPNLKFIDLDGDGHADVLITEDNAFVWHASLAEEGFGTAKRVAQALDEEKGPRVVFADGTQSIYLADLSGDGSSDIVRIRNGEVCYWPNLGYGQFGAKITMDNAPVFDNPEQFDQKRIRLADIDGSGTTDIIYLHRDGVRLYFNQSGNSWSKPQQLEVFPQVSDLASIVLTDLLGNGTACIVWSSSLPADARRPMRYVNLVGEQKAHLLVKSSNNLGAETVLQYAPSTRFYLQDKRDGKPWVTRLPFPVHVVERVETYDHVSRNRFVTRYAYHHGYFDGEEREFRGFAMVEQQDTEEFAAFTGDGTLPVATNVDLASHVAPVLTKTWFHTGVYLKGDHVADFFAGLLDVNDKDEYYREPNLSDAEARLLLVPDTVLPSSLTPEEEREAYRALKGSMLRQEIYSLDGTLKQEHPYTVAEQNFSVRLEQPRGSNRNAVFFTHAREALKFNYERNPADPRLHHALTLEVDAYGNVLKEAEIGYERRATINVVDGLGQVQQIPNPGLAGLSAADQAKQTTALVTYKENRFTNAVEFAEAHRTPVHAEVVTFELTGYARNGPAGRFQAADLVEPDPAVVGRLRHKFTDQVAYEAAPTANPCRRPIEWVRTLYRRDDLNSLLPLGELHSLGLPGETYKLAFTPGLIAQVFRRPRDGQPPEDLLPVPAAVLGGQAGDRGGYVQSQTLKADGRFPATDADDHWWIPSGRSFFTTNPADPSGVELAQARQHFFSPRRYRDAFAHDSVVDLDANDLLAVEARDALGNRHKVQRTDYRVLQPALAEDPNHNLNEVTFDLFGMVAGTATMGKALPAPVEGDSLAGFVTNLSDAQLDSFIDGPDPHANAVALLQNATTRFIYDFDRFRRTRQANPNDPTQWKPVCAATLARETHASAPLPPEGLKISISFSYSDGFAREIQKKIQAEAGPVVEGGPVINPRWAGTGWTIFNNKAKRVRKYEPFFSTTHKFEFGVIVGVSSIMFYDPSDRVIAILHANHTYEKVVFDAWRQDTYDVNDTCAPRNLQTGDPRTDPDISGHVALYFAGLPASPPAPPWQTWRAQRIGGALGPDEQTAANRAAAHADTPTTAHFDPLARPFLTVSRNRVVLPGHDLDGTEDSFFNRVDLDIEGNQRLLRDSIQQAGDPLGRVVMRYTYDMLGNRVLQRSMEAGDRWTLDDVGAKPIRVWDSRGHNFTITYDPLHRKLEERVRGTTAASDPRTFNQDILVEKIEYGESVAGAEAFNLRTHIFRHFDSAGIVTNARLASNGTPLEAYDFKGNPLRTTRQLLSDYKSIANWSLNPALDTETFEGGTRYDALNRPIQSIAPHSNKPGTKVQVIQPVFNESNLLERVNVWLERANEPTSLLNPAIEAPSPVGVANIDFNAKGQRERIDYKNGASTFYQYDPLTFQLTRLFTRRGATFTDDCNNPQSPPATFAAPDTPPPGETCGLQNLRYTYDPAGNVTHIEDDAQQAIYFRNRLVEPSNDYTYDAFYRLIQATGREHLGQTGGVPNPPTAPDAFNAFHTRLDHRGDGNAVGTYIERYVYDSVGNVLKMQHRGSDPAHPGWTRAFDYEERSLIEDGSGGTLLKTSNRLTRTVLNPGGPSPQPEAYDHDPHGNMVRLPHLGGGVPGPNMDWDYKDRLQQTDLGGGGAAYYVYDASGERVRKVWEKSPGLIEERIYLGGFEIFRKHGGAIGANTAILERDTLHVMDDKQRIALVELRTLDSLGTDAAPAQLIRYQFNNHLSSACLELNHEAQIISYEEYAPYGSTMYQAVRSQTETPKRYRFTGKERDEETGLSYHGARYYACWLARWSSADPAGLIDGLNLYRYARDNPIVHIDPDGKQPAEALDPETIAVAATALARAAQAWGSAAVITGGAAAATPVVAAAPAVLPAAAPAAVPVAGAGLAPGAILLGSQVAAAAAMALATRLYMQRAGSIARYGNPYGMPARDIAFPVMREVQRMRNDPFPVPTPLPSPAPAPDERERRPIPGRVYVTYVKYNAQTGRTYSGRTSAVIDLSLPWRPQAEAAVRARDANHHVDENDEPTNPAFGPAVLDQFTVGFAVNYNERYRDVGYLAIRGREQQLIDHYGRQRAAQLGISPFNGGAQSDTNPGTPLTENTIRGVAKDNPLGEVFHQAANVAFGELTPFTGNRLQRAAAP